MAVFSEFDLTLPPAHTKIAAMKIKLDEYGCCESATCGFRKECAQHGSAGDFRSEDGFTPEFSETECRTADATPDEEEYRATGRMHPKPFPSERGFVSLERLRNKATDFQI